MFSYLLTLHFLLRFVEQNNGSLIGACDILRYSKNFLNPSTWTMRVVDNGKRFVVFQRNLNCLNMRDDEALDDNSIDIPKRKILTGKDKEHGLTVMNSSVEQAFDHHQITNASNLSQRQPRTFYVANGGISSSFHPSPVDKGPYSTNPIFDAKQSNSLPNQESEPDQLPDKSYKFNNTPLEDVPLIFSASASLGQSLNPSSTKNFGLTVTYVHSPSSGTSDSPTYGKTFSVMQVMIIMFT